MQKQIRDILEEVGKIPVSAAQLDDNASLYDAGLTSFATVQVMLALEEAFDVEFEDSMLNRRTFASISAIADAITKLQKLPA